jgi:vitamin-K-epoxide reductase (warfarin-sensitive)
MMTTVIIICVVGLIISVYGIFVERKIQQDALYKPACDISDRISCSKAFLSPYGKMLGISNIWASALYYLLILAVAAMNYATIAMLISGAGILATCYFAYILYFKVQSLCPICTSLYATNIALAIACYYSL